MSGQDMPRSSEALLLVLPETLRAAVLAYFGRGPVASAAGTAVGTEANAVGTHGFRRRGESLIYQERATGLEPATSSLGSTSGAHGTCASTPISIA